MDTAPDAAPDPTNPTDLTAIYHAIYDVKDSLAPGSYSWIVADNARRAVADLMREVGVEVPRRYDKAPS